jgi:cyclic pyranopterin phosphate synthase
MKKVNYLRISVTDRCNLNCFYCRISENCHYVTPSEILSYEEILEVVKAANDLGINRIRLTGGEPLMRKDLTQLVRMLSSECALIDLTITTNGVLLSEFARELKNCGLHRVNVSLDTLSRKSYKKITGKDKIDKVLVGIETAVKVGLTPVKINTVLMRGINEDEICEIAGLARKNVIIPRFIELMPIGGIKWDDLFLPISTVRQKLEDKGSFHFCEVEKGSGPAKYYRAGDNTIGLISPISEKFCAACNRIRMTSQGELRPCLAIDYQIPLKQTIRSGKNKKEIKKQLKKLIGKAIDEKPHGYYWDVGTKTFSQMSAIGG